MGFQGVDPPDYEAIERVRRGDTEAFGTLVERHYEACFRYAARMTLDAAEAEDVVQETFVRAYRGLGGYRDRGAFRAWLFRILLNRCRSWARGRERRHVPLGGVEQIAEDRRPADDVLWRSELERALGGLSPLLREAFVLRHVEDLSYEDMARMTGDGMSALKMRVSRAREELRATLEEVMYDR